MPNLLSLLKKVTSSLVATLILFVNGIVVNNQGQILY
jgi:hypothetical protein